MVTVFRMVIQSVPHSDARRINGSDLFVTIKMSSMSGYVNYLKFTAGSNKGNVVKGQTFNDPFRLGDTDPNYTSSRVVVNSNEATAKTNFTAEWKPVIAGTVSITAGDTKYVDNGNGQLVAVATGSTVSRRTVMVQPVEDGYTGYGDTRLEGTEAKVEVVVKDNTGAEVTTSAGTIDYATGAIALTTGVTGDVEFAYSYNNVIIPQNDLPLLTAKMEAMPLLARARRIAIYYSQMAAFQAKTDYGMDLGDQLAEKAVGQLAYEIDTEVVQLLSQNALLDPDLTWSKTQPLGVNLQFAV